jgi:uncharacterized membrane protein
MLSVIIGFIHDFASGCWAATVFAVYWINRQVVSPEASTALEGLKKQFFYAGIICIVIIFATGAGRTFTYVNNVYGEDSEKTRRKMLIIKHIALLIIFGAGTYWQYHMVFK